jgi:hypothetical protein
LTQILKPFIIDRGHDWEINVTQSDKDLWTLNSLFPPPPQSDEEKLWAKENKAIPWY